MKKKRMFAIQGGLLLINIIVVMFISVFIYMTTNRILDNYDAREFIDGVVSIPGKPADLIWKCMIFLLILMISFVIREGSVSSPNHSRVVSVTLMVDAAAILAILMIQNFNYNGIILLVFANVMFNMRSSRTRWIVIAIAIFSFLIADNEMLIMNYRLFNLDDYINYYDAGTRQTLIGIFRILESLNIIVFVSFCIQIITDKNNTIDEVNSLYQELEKANVQLMEYAAMSEKMAQTKERNRLAREIHDTLGHALTGISAGIDACMAIIDIAPDKTKQQLEVISDVTRNSIKEVRRSMNELRPDALERFSLQYAIQKMITDMTALSNQKVYFTSEVKNLKFDEDEEMAIYRVIQESITNAIRHGEADTIWISIKKDMADIILMIKDNGKGCTNIVNGFGTRHIKERIEMLGGKVSFDGNNGFVVEARIPIRWGENYD